MQHHAMISQTILHSNILSKVWARPSLQHDSVQSHVYRSVILDWPALSPNLNLNPTQHLWDELEH